MTAKQIALIAFTALMLGSLFYVAPSISNAKMPRTFHEFRPKHAWLIIAPLSGIILWFWALFDWGTTEMAAVPKFLWLLLLIFTMGLALSLTSFLSVFDKITEV